MRSSQKAFLAIGVAYVLAVAFLPTSEAVGGVLFTSGLAVSVGLVWRRAFIAPSAERTSWRLLAVALSVYLLAVVARYQGQTLLHLKVGYPSVVDGAFFVSYGLMAACLLSLARRRMVRLDALLDSVMVAVVLGSLSLHLLLEPLLHEPHGTDATFVVSLAYPIATTLIACLAAQLLMLGRGLRRGGVFLAMWVVGEVLADGLLVRDLLIGDFRLGASWFGLWAIAYVALGLLALDREPMWGLALTTEHPRRRLIVLSVLGLVPVAQLAVGLGDPGHMKQVHLGFVVAFMVALAARAIRLVMVVETEQVLRLEVERLLAQREHAATHDDLTGLANRAAFRTSLDAALKARRAPGHVAAVMIADLDSFKTINDVHGHAGGDAVLLQIGQRIATRARAGDVAARLGGDEFAVVVANISVSDAVGFADRFASLLNEPVQWSGVELAVSASVGLYLADTEFDLEGAVAKADAALYGVKNDGGGRAELFDEAHHSRFIERHQVELELRQAITRGELVLYYQPVVDLVSRRTVGAEALIRWQHPVQGLLSPAAFIDIAETSGAILAVGKWVLTQACLDGVYWQREIEGASDVGVAVNVSRRQLQSPSIVNDAHAALESSGLAASQLTIEVTETALMTDIDEMVQVLDKLSALGVVLALDDFGTGYSSLAQLRELPIDILKIDKAFVDGIARNDEEWALASAIVRLANSLGKLTLAEGIEVAAQLAHLRSLGCQLGQGYLFAHPMPLAEFLDFLREHNSVHS